MNAIVHTLNTAGRAFVEFAVPMLIQSSLLILILLAVDAILRRRVRAVFRYWIWMLVLVKLVLPPSLWSPVSFGTWFGDKLEVPIYVHAVPEPSVPDEEDQDGFATKSSPAAADILLRPPWRFVESPGLEPTIARSAPTLTEAVNEPAPIDRLPGMSLDWQGLVLLVWAGVVAALLLLLAQRMFFVRGLVAQADEAGRAMLRELDQCRQHLGLRGPLWMRLSPNAASPAVCGLWRLVILVPQNLASRLHGTDLQAVLFHELAHVQRGDLWINLVQTLLQIVYFYNPLLWLANAKIRRTREKAVDETVLVALGDAAPQYPETLVNVAKLAFRRPALSLRLIGVVESKSALTSRIKHILNRPLPKTAKLGVLGLVGVLVIATVLLPMAKAKSAGGGVQEAALASEEQEGKDNQGAGVKTDPLGPCALSFDGVRDKLIVPPSPSLRLKSAFSIEIWVQPDFSSSDGKQWVEMIPLQKGRKLDDPDKEQAGGFLLRLAGSSSQPDLQCRTSLWLGKSKGGLSQAGFAYRQAPWRLGWHYFCVRCDGKNHVPVPDEPLVIGGFRMGQSLPFKGKIGQIRIWSKVLTDAEVRRYGATTLSGKEPNLVACWTFGEGSGPVVHDLSPNHNDAHFDRSPDRAEAGPKWVALSNAPEPGQAGSTLELCVAPKSDVVGGEVGWDLRGGCEKALAEGRAPADSRFVWIAARPGASLTPHVLSKAYNGTTWLLARNDAPYRLVSSQGWRLAHVRRDPEGTDASTAALEFEGPGTERWLQLIRPYAGHALAVVVNGFVVSAPVLLEDRPLQRVLIVGGLTERGFKDTVAALGEDVSRPPAPTGAGVKPPAAVRPGPIGRYALSFDGADDCLTVPPSPSLKLKPPFSIEVWAKPDFSGLQALAPRERPDENRGPEMSLIRQGNQLQGPDRASVNSVGGENRPATRPGITDGSFGGYAGLLADEKGGMLYGVLRDGMMRQMNPFRTNRLPADHPGWLQYWTYFSPIWRDYVPADGPLVIGAKTVPDRLVFKGQIARICLWNRELTPEETRYHASMSPTGNEPNLVACWTFQEGGGQIVHDLGPNHNEAYLGASTETDDSDPRWIDLSNPSQPPAAGESHDTPPSGSAVQDRFRDSDGDGLSDFDEIHKYLTDPAKKDSDGDGIPDGDWNERREYTYSVRTVLRYLPPFDEKALNDDFQDGRILKRTNEYIEVEVIHYPFATAQESILENCNWRQDDAPMHEFLAPGATTNWDEPMRRDLIAALKADGIEVETLSDKQVVEQVSRWLLKRSRYLDKAFTTYYVHFPQGKPTVYPGLEEAFRHDFERDSANYNWTIDQHFDHELLGKGMFYNKTHGSCTSTAVYLTTVLRALGIPTRMILVTPAVDASDRAQVLLVKKAVTHNRVRMTMLAGLGRSSHGFTNHTFNEVYVGNRWCRLDYQQLGCPSFGLQTHVYTFNDLSNIDLAPTWGWRYAKGEHSDVFQHDNPYTAVEVSEQFGAHGKIANPPCTAQEIDPHSQPDVFLFYPHRADVGQGFMEVVERTTANKTSRFHERESYENLFEGIWLSRPQDILVLLFSLDTPERVPAGYEDLLPKSWPQIEAQLKQGQTVELSGKARGMNVIVLAAPTADGLKPLVQNSELLRAMGGASSVPGVAPAQPRPIAPPAGQPVKLANGATVELLGVCEYPSEGQRWWRPDGSALEPAPYRTTRNKRELKEGFRDYELVVRYGGAPDMDIEWSVPDSTGTGVTGSPYDASGRAIGDLTVCTVRFPQTQTVADLRIGVATGAWETRAVHRPVDREGAYSLGGGRAVAFGIAHFQEGRTLVPVTTNFSRDDIDFRVVAVREQEEAYTGGLSGFGDGNLRSLTYLFNCPLSEIKEFRVQTRPWTWVDFKSVSLRPGLRTAPPSAEKSSRVARQPPGGGKVVGIGPAWEVLKNAMAGRYGGSIGGFSSDDRQRAEYFEKVLSWTHPGDTLVLMLTFDKPVGVPPQYGDLLPLPWAEIQARVGKGEMVEARGVARNLDVIVLAAPTSEQLNALVRRTHLLDAFRSEAGPEPTAVQAAPPSGTDQEKEIVLPEVDRQQVVLDLATRALVSLPPVGPEPEKVQQALRKLGKGDLLYDCDSGDRTLILLRDATSEQAQGDTGEPSWKGYLIGPHLPGVLTVKTAEGRQYRITILAADDNGCTLKYSLVTTDKGAGGGALIGPGKGGSTLELRIALTNDELDPAVVEGCRKALAEGRTPPGGRYVWVPVRPGMNLSFTLVTQTQDNKTWLLVHNDESFIMVPAQGCRLAHVGRMTDNDGRTAVTVDFDEAGGDRLARLTQAYDGHHLALIVADVVVAAPMIRGGQGGFRNAVITGNFTEPALEEMIESLRRGMIQQSSPKLPVPGNEEKAGESDTIRGSAGPAPEALQRRLDEAQSGSVVTIPNGRYTTPIEITKPVVLRGESREGCILEITGDQPAILIDTKRQGQVTVENLTIRWQLATGQKVQLPSALWVKGTNALIRNCRFAPLGDFQRCPMAVYIDGPSKSTVDNCRFSGFDYVVCYGPGTEGTVQDCFIADCGHQGVINYDGATLTVQRNIITGSKFHAVRCTGGTLHVKDNLLINNANRAIYLGNKSGRGTITNNLIVGNGTGISGFGRADYAIANNVLVKNSFAGIDMRDSCRFSIRNNVLVKNQRGLALFKEGTENYNSVAANLFWNNATDVQDLEKPASSLAVDPQFADPNHGDFTVRGPAQAQGHGLTNPQVLKDLWKRYEQLRAPSAEAGQPQTPARDATPSAPQEFSGRVVDSTGKPVSGAQVAVSTEKMEVVINNGVLDPPRGGDTAKGQLVETDAQGRFQFEGKPPESFELIAASHEGGFAVVTSDVLRKSREIRLEKWGRIEGQLAPGREALEGQIHLSGMPNSTWLKHRHAFRYEAYCGQEGRFVFEKVPAGWFEVGYLRVMGDNQISSVTSRTPVVVRAGETAKMKLGGEGRPVVGRFVPPPGYKGSVYFGAGLRALQTRWPDPPRPANYQQMTKREQQQWSQQWRQTPAAQAYSDAIWHDPNWRGYVFRINADGTFRIEDVIPGKYDLAVDLQEQHLNGGRYEEFGGYRGPIDVPPMTAADADKPLDLGDLTLYMRTVLHVGDMAPLFEARTLDGKDIRLIDHRGKFVLLSFWQPTFHPELDRLKQLYQTYGSTGQLAIIDFGGSDTLGEVRSYVEKHQIEWPEIYLGEKWENEIAKRYDLPGVSYILLVNPEGKIVATWLRGERLTNAVRDAFKSVSDAVPTADSAPNPGLAWQRTDRYVPPDPNGFFPDDPAGGQKLDTLFQAVDKDQRSDEEILSTVRQGLRRTTQQRTLILSWIGTRYIWNKDPQNAQAVEIMYHAVPLERHYAVYFGLSVLRDKPANVLRTLADVCLQSGDEVGRISWGLGPQREAVLPYLAPYLQDQDAAKREIAGMLVKHFKGELDFEQWRRQKGQEQVKAQFAGQVPQLKQTLLTGDSDARYRALSALVPLMRAAGGPMFLDDSLLPALLAASADPDGRVRNEVVRTVGGRWVWAAPKQDPNAIALMLKLSADRDREVRYNAVYYGLSVVRDKSEPVVRRLVEMALADHENNVYGRIVWGLRGFSKGTSDIVGRVLAEEFGRAKSDVHRAASIYSLYRDVLEKDPPEDWELAQIRQRYPEDLFVLPVSAREPFQPKDMEALWSEFTRALPAGITAERLPAWYTNEKHVCYARMRGKEQAETVRNTIGSHPRLRAGEIRPLPLTMQLYLEEMRDVAPARVAGTSSQPSPGATTSTQGPAPAQGPGPIQQKINAAAPGATIRLEPGVYQERLTIDKPLTLEGAGWDKTTILVESRVAELAEEIERTAKSSPGDLARLRKQLLEDMGRPVLALTGARGVTVRGVKLSGPGRRTQGQLVELAIVKLSQCEARLSDCAVVAGPGSGILVGSQSSATIERCLVAAVWGTGIAVGVRQDVSEARIVDSDIRNCHYAGIGVGRNNKATIERCRVSGAAWHGIRYDDASPQIAGNLISGNARSGIYASGQTAAVVKGNLFYANEMGGMSCWFQNQDLIEGNTFANNKQSGLSILGASKPSVRRNIFYADSAGVTRADVSDKSPFAKSDGSMALESNIFWANEHDLQRGSAPGTFEPIALDEKTGIAADPQFVAPGAKDFSLKADSPARQKGIGAADPLSFRSPWPLQPEERAIIPKGDTRDYRQWRDPVSSSRE